jgi:DNA-binding CsgD family transcriptional regulator
MSRIGRVERATKETKVLVEIDLDGSGVADVSTGVGFFDHMLDQLAKHGLFDLTVRTGERLELEVARPTVMVFIADPGSGGAVNGWRRLYGLTAAESLLASALVACGTLDEAADALAITKETARSTIKRVYRKTEAKGQADLVRLALCGFGSLGGGPTGALTAPSHPSCQRTMPR